jgi:hypothetical protein
MWQVAIVLDTAALDRSKFKLCIAKEFETNLDFLRLIFYRIDSPVRKRGKRRLRKIRTLADRFVHDAYLVRTIIVPL